MLKICILGIWLNVASEITFKSVRRQFRKVNLINVEWVYSCADKLDLSGYMSVAVWT